MDARPVAGRAVRRQQLRRRRSDPEAQVRSHLRAAAAGGQLERRRREPAAALGQEFYFDPRFSGNATLVDSIGQAVPVRARRDRAADRASPAPTCHDPRRAGSDFTSAPNTVSIGAGWYDVNGQQTVNAAFYPLLYWNGRTDSLWAQAAAVSESGVSMNGDRGSTRSG